MYICSCILRLYTCQISSADRLFQNGTGIFPKTKAEGHLDVFQLRCWWALYLVTHLALFSGMAVE